MSNAQDESPVYAPVPINTFITRVARVRQIGKPFTRVTFRSGDLERFRSIGPDQFLYLLLPPAGQSELTIDSSFDWDQYRNMNESERPVGAYYTVRHHRPETAEIDIDIVKHGHHSQVGGWLRNAGPGHPAALWGPRMAYNPPPGTTRQLLLGDETALPAIASILESGQLGTPVDVIVELDPATELNLPNVDELSIARLARPANGTSCLPAALRGRTIESSDYVWAAGESDVMRELRTDLKDCVRLPVNRVSVIGYWRRA